MKGRAVIVATLLALALLLPAVALAAGAAPAGGSAFRQSSPRLAPATHLGVRGAASVPRASRLAAPRLGIITNGPCTVTGVVQDRSGTPVAGATVDWGYYDGQSNWVFGNTTTTQNDGSFSFTGVTATTNGELDVYLSSTAAYQAWDLAFSAPPATNDFVLWPAIVPFSTTRSSDHHWNYWDSVVVDTWGSTGGGTTMLAETGNAYVMPPDYDHAVVYYFSNQAAEWTSFAPVPVAAGGTGATPIGVSQDGAQSVLITKPYWASGKPGTTFSLRMGNWPLASEAMFYGYSEYPRSYPEKDYTNVYLSNGSDRAVALTVPTNATPGYDFLIHAFRVDGASLLDINDYFQVCTLKSSKTSLRRGGAIRLSGTVPLAGHWGSKLAPAGKRVTIFKRTTAPSAQPTNWTSPQGWTKVTSPLTTRAGGYHSGLLYPARTTWYIVRYPTSSNAATGQFYWGAFTSILRVRVY